MLISLSKAKLLLCILTAVMATLVSGCASPLEPDATPTPKRTRAEAIPRNALKMTPELDALPPQLHSDAYHAPVPLSGVINTAGGEDSAFTMPDGSALYFWFTPDVSIPPEKQLLDGVTGIYVSQKRNGQWNEPQRIFVQDSDELSLDGCPFVEGNRMWFCSARKGN